MASCSSTENILVIRITRLAGRAGKSGRAWGIVISDSYRSFGEKDDNHRIAADSNIKISSLKKSHRF